MEQTKNIKRKANSRLVICIFCKKAISNNTFRALVCICEKNNFFHWKCYEKSSGEADIDKILKDFEEASIKY